MHIRLSAEERAHMKACVCPRGVNGVVSSPSAKTLGRIIVGFIVVDALVALFWPVIALIILAIIFVLGIVSTCWHLVRGHTLKCSVLWGFGGWIFFLIDGIIGGI